MKAVFLTAGAAGMYCGSCMHDNALARALRDQGVDCLLQPVYTPIRTDGVSLAGEGLFFGGIHIYLLQQMPWIRRVPARIRRLLDWSFLIRLATRRAHSTDAAQLSQLTISMLKGADGAQADEVERLVHWLADQIKPDAVVLSNLLIGGSLPAIREALPDARLVVLLQGDDIFLDHLPADSQQQVIGLCRQLVPHVDCFVVNSRFYADKMGKLFQIPDEKIEIAPLSIDTQPFEETAATESTAGTDGSFRLGYLARVAPEKGLHHLVDAFAVLAQRSEHDNLSLHVAGWLGEANRGYLDNQRQKLERAGLADRFVYHGSPDLEAKIQFLRSLDALSVPTDYHDPKGLFILESLAAGVPVVQPAHGAFVELIESTGGGILVAPGDTEELCRAIESLKRDRELRARMGREGAERVHANHNIDQAAKNMKQILFPAHSNP